MLNNTARLLWCIRWHRECYEIVHMVRVWWKNSIVCWHIQIETFSALLVLCAGNSPVTGEFPTQRPWRGALMLSLNCAWINGWVNNREAGDLRGHCAHCDVIVMGNTVIALHYSDANASQIAGNSNVVQPYWPLAIGINQWPMNCLKKMTMMQRAFPY